MAKKHGAPASLRASTATHCLRAKLLQKASTPGCDSVQHREEEDLLEDNETDVAASGRGRTLSCLSRYLSVVQPHPKWEPLYNKEMVSKSDQKLGGTATSNRDMLGRQEPNPKYFQLKKLSRTRCQATGMDHSRQTAGPKSKEPAVKSYKDPNAIEQPSGTFRLSGKPTPVVESSHTVISSHLIQNYASPTDSAGVARKKNDRQLDSQHEFGDADITLLPRVGYLTFARALTCITGGVGKLEAQMDSEAIEVGDQKVLKSAFEKPQKDRMLLMERYFNPDNKKLYNVKSQNISILSF
ncbi:hypothetical protein B0H14DRAFT_2621554 [Mycena olivaceomarginata]|nr:hypothetical protein B0H14DRAFT_2621554 [Mycena olivaceomarginata]